MSAESINISLPELTNTASTIRSLNQNLSDNLNEIMSTMDSLAQSWDSESSETIRAKFKALQPRFTEYYDKVEDYSKFLDKTVESYETTENTINQFANEFI